PVFASCNKILSGSNVGMFKPSYYFMILFSFANSATDGASFFVVPLPVLGVSCLSFSLTAAFTDSSNDFLNSLMFLSVFSALSARRKSANVEGNSFSCNASTASERKILLLISASRSASSFSFLVISSCLRSFSDNLDKRSFSSNAFCIACSCCCSHSFCFFSSALLSLRSDSASIFFCNSSLVNSTFSEESSVSSVSVLSVGSSVSSSAKNCKSNFNGPFFLSIYILLFPHTPYSPIFHGIKNKPQIRFKPIHDLINAITLFGL